MHTDTPSFQPKAIPTVYRGCTFRSRLEARWAAFFDEVGWPWQYEPLDLNGYIPDFVLDFYEPMLVEVKPALKVSELMQYTPKIMQSGWKQEALIVGAGLFDAWGDACLGIMVQYFNCVDEDGKPITPNFLWSRAVFEKCQQCGRPSFYHEDLTFTCRVSGCYEGDHYLGPIKLYDALPIWNRAASKVQWKGQQ